MDSEDSRDQSSSSSSSSSSRSRRSSSSDRSESSKKNVKSPPRSPTPPGSEGPRSPSPESESPSANFAKRPQSPDNLSGAHSDINSPENSLPPSPAGSKSPDGPHSPSDAGSNIGSPSHGVKYSTAPTAGDGPKTPQSPTSSVKSAPGSPDNRSRPASPESGKNPQRRSPSSSSSPGRNSYRSSPNTSPAVNKNDWSPKERSEKWRRHTKAEQKMVSIPRARSRSDSSQSSRSSYNKRNIKDPATEEISDGEMESDQEDRKSEGKSVASDKHGGKDHNISHEDLSDVSDLESVGPEDANKETKSQSSPTSPVKMEETKINGTSLQSSPHSENGKGEAPKLEKVPQEKTSNTEDGEEQLDFEAEEGECVEPKAEQSNGDASERVTEKEEIKPGRRSRGSSLEEGEVSDEAERRPEESEPRPVCRFFSRGACTWGVSCRFLHPGVTDKGNYNMFDVVRGVPASGCYPPAPTRDTAPPESAWERGLRTAKEMLRIANKRKEQDMDFEEKKLHLSVGGVVHDPDAELAYAAAAVGASPPRQHDGVAVPAHYRDPEAFRPYGPMYRGRIPRPTGDERERYYDREHMYERERAYERVPHFDERAPAPEEGSYHKRRVRSSREVIVQRAEVERREAREGREVREGREARRGDDWADPWMRAEPAARRRKPPSSDDSYSSSSSRSSRSPSARRKRRASSSSRQRLSPSVIVRERRLATARATAMNPPAPRRRAPSPAAARQLSANPPAPATHRHKDELEPYGRNKASSRNRDRKKYSRSSSSESSSSSSESESESHSSSTSGSSGARRARHARLLNAAARPRLNPKSNTGLAAVVTTITSKKEVPADKELTAKKRAASPINAVPMKKPVSRREELLKQLKAVEDAIARKRSKI